MNFDRKLIERYCNQYIAGFEDIPEHLEGLDNSILASWRRSKRKANPFEATPMPMSNKEYSYLMEQNDTLVHIALPYMIKFYEVAKSATQNVLLTDATGKQLKNVSADSANLLDLMSKAHVINGIDYSENTCGTSSVSLSLYEDKPILLRGAEHYRKIYHNLACFSAPIHSLSNKQVGCICIVGQLDNYQPFIMNALIVMIQAIENELRLHQTNDILNHVVSNIKQGFLLLNSNYDVLLYNNKALQILEISADLTNQNIHSYFQNDFSSLKNNSNLALIKSNGVNIYIDLKIIPIQGNHKEDLYLLIFSSLEDLKKETFLRVGYIAKYHFRDIIGNSKEIEKVKELGKIAASNHSNVLILGENGTGKELLAQAIHNDSIRKTQPFISLHCGSIPKELLELELFGDEERKQMGKIELANEGTLFLDEIDNLSLECQTRLFQFLSHKISNNRKMDVRIIASSNNDLLYLVKNNKFRDDLYYILNIINIQIPPLQKRRGDIELLIQLYLQRYRVILKREIKGIEKECLSLLINYNWPGNIRQLESVIEQCINVATGPYIRLLDLPDEIVKEALMQRYKSNVMQEISSPETVEYGEIVKLIKQEHGHMKTISKILNMPLSTLYRKCNKYNIDPKQYREW